VRALPSARELSTPTLNDHIPALLVEVSQAFRRNSDAATADVLAEGTPPEHGLQRLHDGYMIEEVVAEYNILRGCIHDLASEHGINLQGKPFHILNLVFDSAIGLAVQTFSMNRALEVQRRRNEYLAFIAHDLRTPLNAVLGFAQLMASDTPPPSASQQRSLDQILNGGWYLLRLINEILDLSMIESGRVAMSREAMALTEVLRDCRAMIAPQAQKRDITLSFPSLDQPFYVHADLTRVKQVVINLLSNAIKYNRTGGSVQVECKQHGEKVRLSVRDTGNGLSAEQLQQLFQPFNRLGQEAGTEEGTGIGLVVTKQLVELMGGTLGVESEVGLGHAVLDRIGGLICS